MRWYLGRERVIRQKCRMRRLLHVRDLSSKNSGTPEEAEKEEGGESPAAVIRAFPDNEPFEIPDPPEFDLPDGSKEERLGWLREKVESCPTCLSELNPNGKVIFGCGDPDADLFLCGEAPGAEEEQQGSVGA